MNINAAIVFNTEKPTIVSIRKTETVNIFAVGLMKDQILAKHKTSIPALLIVLKGAILFQINGEEIKLVELDTHQIPLDVQHEVIGISNENIFIITQEKIK